jgi:hypothetical protein
MVFFIRVMFSDIWMWFYHGGKCVCVCVCVCIYIYVYVYSDRCHKYGVVTEIFRDTVVAVLLQHSIVLNTCFYIHHRISLD